MACCQLNRTFVSERERPRSQQQNTVVSPVFESLIWLRSHKVRLFMALTAAFCNRIHTCTFSGLTTAFLEHTLCEWNGLTTSLILLWSLSLWLLVRNTGLTPGACSYRQYSKSKLNCKFSCVNETFRDSHL